MTHLPRPRRWLLLAVLLMLHAGLAWMLVAFRPSLPRPGDETPVSYVTMVPPAAPRPITTVPPPQQAPTRKRQAAVMPAPVRVEVKTEVKTEAEAAPPVTPDAAPVAGLSPSAEPLDKGAVLGAARSPDLLTAEEKARAVKDIRSMDDNKFARAISKAARPNCIDAVKKGQSNVLTLVPMIFNDLRDKGCKW